MNGWFSTLTWTVQQMEAVLFFCHQSVGLIQRMAEAAGIATVSMDKQPERITMIKPPRVLRVRFGRVGMLGEPGNAERHRTT